MELDTNDCVHICYCKGEAKGGELSTGLGRYAGGGKVGGWFTHHSPGRNFTCHMGVMKGGDGERWGNAGMGGGRFTHHSRGRMFTCHGLETRIRVESGCALTVSQ